MADWRLGKGHDRLSCLNAGVAVKKPVSLLRCMNDPHLFGPFFVGETWRKWRALVAAMFGDPEPFEGALDIFRELTGRETWPEKPFRETALIFGRRAGKSRVLGAVAAYLCCFRDFTPSLAPGEKAVVAIMAVDRAQAGMIFEYALGLVDEAPLLKARIVNRGVDEVEFQGRVVLSIATTSFRRVRGRTYAAVLCDEIAVWHDDETSSNPATEVLRAARPGLATIKQSLLIMASSPYAQRGELYNVYRRHFGKDDALVLVAKAASMVMNPSEDLKPVIDEAYELDPESAAAEWGANFRSDLVSYVSDEAVEAVIVWGRTELLPEPGIEYRAFGDLSGGGADAMVLAIGHISRRGTCVLDAILEFPGASDINLVVEGFVALLRRFGIEKFKGDKYAREWPVARFREAGIEFIQDARPKSDIYIDFLSLINAKRIELLDHKRTGEHRRHIRRRLGDRRKQQMTMPRRRLGRDFDHHVAGLHQRRANAFHFVCLLGRADLSRRRVGPAVRAHVTIEEAGRMHIGDIERPAGPGRLAAVEIEIDQHPRHRVDHVVMAIGGMIDAVLAGARRPPLKPA
jgi:hypothetical protein